MEGGATFGYCATGNWVTARPPRTMIRIETTQAKTGLSMKKRAMRAAVYGVDWSRDRGAGSVEGESALATETLLNGTVLTTEPGGAFWDPSTMIFSPGSRPFITTTLAPTS